MNSIIKYFWLMAPNVLQNFTDFACYTIFMNILCKKRNTTLWWGKKKCTRGNRSIVCASCYCKLKNEQAQPAGGLAGDSSQWNFCRSGFILIFSYCDLCTTAFLWSRLRRTLLLAAVRCVRYWRKQNCLAPSASRLYSPSTELDLIV